MPTFTTAGINTWFQTIDGLPATTASISTSLATMYVDELNATPPTATPGQIQADLENFPFNPTPPPTNIPTDLFYRTTVAQFVLREFQAAWDVVPSTGAGSQYDNWVARIIADPTLESGGMSQALAGTTQFMELYGTTSATELASLAFVTQLAANLHVAVGPGALMNVGLPVWQVLQNFVTSPVVIASLEAPIANFQNLLLAGAVPGGSIFDLPLPTPTLTLTVGIDTPTTGFTSGHGATATAAGSTFEAQPAGNAPLGLTNTLNTGDVLLATDAAAGATTLDFTAVTNPLGLANPPFVTGLTMTGVNQANITNNAHTVAGFQGVITGLTTVDDINSLAGVQVGAPNQGLQTVLTNVNISGYSGSTAQGIAHTPIFDGVIAASLGSASNTINIGITGGLGSTAFHNAAILQFSTDGAAGTAASPNLSYGTWSITAASAANLQLQQNGVGGATELDLHGAGAIAVGQDAPGNWGQNLETIDASGATGSIVITGGVAGDPTNYISTAANPGGRYGSDAGLLQGDLIAYGDGNNFSLTEYDLGKGSNILDVANADDTELAGLTTVSQPVALGSFEEIIVASSALNGATSSTFANIAGFSALGVAFNGGTTSINMAAGFVPAGINTIIYQTESFGDVTITNQSATLTVDVEDNAFGNSLTVSTSGGAETLDLILGNPNHTGTGGFGDGHGHLGALTTFGDDIVNITSTSGAPNTATTTMGTASLTPIITGSETVTITASATGFGGPFTGDTDLVVGTPAGGAIWDFNPVSHALNPFNMTLTDNNDGALTLVNDTALNQSTNAWTINASAAGGPLLMEGGDANFIAGTTVLTSVGNNITGADATGNVLIGSLGNDVFKSTSTGGGDQIVTDGGTDSISLASTSGDTVDLFVGISTAGGVVSHVSSLGGVPLAGDIVTPVATAETANPGWWGVGAGGAHLTLNTIATAAGFGVTADLSIVSGAANGSAGTGDAVGFSLGAWDGFLAGTNGGPASLANATLSNLIGIGGTLTAPTANIIDIGVGTFNTAATLANSIAAGGITLSGNMATGDHSFLVAYQNSANGGGVTVADLFVDNLGAPTALIKGSVTEHIAVSDMVELTGVNLANLSGGNFHLIA